MRGAAVRREDAERERGVGPDATREGEVVRDVEREVDGPAVEGDFREPLRARLAEVPVDAPREGVEVL